MDAVYAIERELAGIDVFNAFRDAGLPRSGLQDLMKALRAGSAAN
ncbi:MAG: hypothetical protein ACOZDY_20805 [Pseudomonadota bacterium]